MSELGAWVRHCADVLYDADYQFPERPEGDFSFGKYVAKILADSEDVQHIQIVIVGQSGSGKSTTAYAIATSIARALAEIFGDTPNDHFNPRTHISILDDQTTQNIMQMCATLMHQIYIIDEGTDDTPGRRAMSQNNLDKLKMAVTVRTSQSCIIRCVQFENLIDSSILNQATHIIRIVEPHHKEGYNIVKIKEMKVFGDNARPYRVYMKPNGRDKLVRHIIRAPDRQEYEWYINERKEAANALLSQIAEGPRELELPKRELVRQRCEKAWTDYMDESHPYKRLSKCALDADIDPKTLQKWMGRNGHTENERVKE